MNSILDEMQHGELKVIGRLIDASNATLLAEISSTKSKTKVIYKPIAGERPLWDFPNGNLAHREYCAYLISEIGQFDLVPATILREGPFGLGMVQQWIEINGDVNVVEYGQGSDPQLRKMAIFDAIINNTDRKYGQKRSKTDQRTVISNQQTLTKRCDHHFWWRMHGRNCQLQGTHFYQSPLRL